VVKPSALLDNAGADDSSLERRIAQLNGGRAPVVSVYLGRLRPAVVLR